MSVPETPVAVPAADGKANFWEEVLRRRREERQRLQQKSTSEVQQLLQEVRQERAVQSPTTAVEPAHGGLLRHPRSRRAASLSPPPRKPSEVQKILAEVRTERTAAAKPSPASGDAKRPARAPQGRHTSPRVELFPETRREAQPRRPPVPRFRPDRAETSVLSTSSRELSSTPKRRLELGKLGVGFTGRWSAGLRDLGSSKDEQSERFATKTAEAYPAGGWDNRTSCPTVFDDFPQGVIRRHVEETTRVRAPRRRSTSPPNLTAMSSQPRASSSETREGSRSRSMSPASPAERRRKDPTKTEQRFQELLKDAQQAVLRATAESTALPLKEETQVPAENAENTDAVSA